MKPKKATQSIEDILRARQFLDGNISKEIAEWAKKLENQKLIDRQRQIRLKDPANKKKPAS